MSARQRKRLLAALSEPLGSASESEDAAAPARPKYAFSALMSDESSTDDEASSDQAAVVPEVIPEPQISPVKRKPKNKSHSEDTHNVEASWSATKESVLPTWFELLKPSEKLLNAQQESLSALGIHSANSNKNHSRRGKGANLLVNAEDGWSTAPSKVSGGFSMSKELSSQHIPNFQLDYSTEYRRLDDEYAAVQAAMDPALTMQFMERYPYYLPGLKDLCVYFRTTRRPEMAAKTLRRALFALESAWHPSFKPWQAPCSVSWSEPDNRIMFELLFEGIMAAGRAGAPTAAFNLACLQLSIGHAAAAVNSLHTITTIPTTIAEETDPMRVLLCVDHYAARAGKWRWIIDATAPSGLTIGHSRVPCVWLPNMCFSRAVALCMLPQQRRKDGDVDVAVGASDSVDYKHAACIDGTYAGYGALRMMIRACLSYPEVIIPLLQGLTLTAESVGFADIPQRTDGVVGELLVSESQCKWKNIFTHAALKRVKPGPASRLCDLFVQRHVSAFRNRTVLCALYAAAYLSLSLMDVADGNTAVLDNELSHLLLQEYANVEEAVAEVHTARLVVEALYENNSSASMLYAHQAIHHYNNVVVSDFLDDAVTFTEDELRGMEAADNGFDQHHLEQDQRLVPLDMQQNIVWVFLYSLLPWYVVPEV